MSTATTPSRFSLYLKLIRFDRPIGTLLLLWPTLWALWLATAGKPDWLLVLVFIAGTFLMRSAGCAINDYADQKYDAKVARTAERPLASGALAPREALWVAGVLALAALILVVVFLNRLTQGLSVIAALLAASYPYTKRFLAMPQAYLGVAFGFGIPMAFAATTNTVPALAWWLMLANICWTIAYDTEYAMVDRDDDLTIGIKTSAILFGRFDVAAVMVCYAGALALLAWIGDGLQLGWPFWLGLGLAGAVAIYHFSLIRARQKEGCFRAFLHNNWFGLSIFAGLFFTYLLEK